MLGEAVHFSSSGVDFAEGSEAVHAIKSQRLTH